MTQGKGKRTYSALDTEGFDDSPQFVTKCLLLLLDGFVEQTINELVGALDDERVSLR